MKTIYKILISLVITTIVVVYLISQLSTNEGRYTLLGSTFVKNSECTIVNSELSSATPLSVTCDAYNPDASISYGKAFESAALAISLTVASTTDSDAVVTLTYSDDGTTWYANDLVSDEAMASTTTLTSATTTAVNHLYNVLTPTRYIKASFTTDNDSTSTVSAKFIPKN